MRVERMEVEVKNKVERIVKQRNFRFKVDEFSEYVRITTKKESFFMKVGQLNRWFEKGGKIDLYHSSMNNSAIHYQRDFTDLLHLFKYCNAHTNQKFKFNNKDLQKFCKDGKVVNMVDKILANQVRVKLV